jgi:two-component system, NtrC family, sensor histidine kinase PilS
MSEDISVLKKKLKALIAFRIIFVTLFFGSSFFFLGFERFPYVRSISYLIVFLFMATIIYIYLLERMRDIVPLAYTQLVLDVIFEIFLIYFTGGIDSWFSFTLMLSIIASSVVLNEKAGFIIATLSSILYGILVNLQFYGVLPVTSGGYMEEKDYLYKIFIHTIFFYVTAYLSGYLSSRLEKTAQKLEERDLDVRDLEIFNREVLENMSSGLFTTDIDGKVVMFNRAAERITGIQRSSVIGQKIDTVFPFFQGPFSEGRREETIKVDGMKKIIGLNISMLKGSAESMQGFIVIFQDLTELKRLEKEMKQKEKWAAIGELSSNIAHEIRNPLASLKGSIEMLKEGSVPDNQKERLMEIALNEMDRLNRVITDFLTYSRPTPAEFRMFDLHRLLDETLELLENVDQDRSNLSIRKEYGGTLEVKADPQKLRQVFWNLGINAVEAMPEGGELVVSTRNADRLVEITFKDSGSGIDREHIEKIFYPFFTTKEKGTGLGLAIAYRIVEEHNGILRVASSSGIGTTFEVILPRSYEKT